MPKENTHLFFAHGLIISLDGSIGEAVKRNIDYYYLGSVAPDIFFYGKNLEECKISASLHGKDGEPTNKIIFELLDIARKKKDEKILAFSLGYLTHCALDIAFHPVVIPLTGDIFCADPEKRAEANFFHREWETALDADVNKDYYYADLVTPGLVEEVGMNDYIFKKYRVSPKRILELVKRQLLVNKLIRSGLAYQVFLFLSWIGLYKRKEDLALCYARVKNRKIIPKVINYPDFITGEKLTTSVKKILADARSKAEEMLEAAGNYYQGRINREELGNKIPGKSLETGRVDCPVSKMKYFNN